MPDRRPYAKLSIRPSSVFWPNKSLWNAAGTDYDGITGAPQHRICHCWRRTSLFLDRPQTLFHWLRLNPGLGQHHHDFRLARFTFCFGIPGEDVIRFLLD